MDSFKIDRTQHAIGQGGFHSAMVYRGGRRFGVVVDCGGASGEQRADLCAAFAENSPRDYDVLAISRLDDDHVNGLPHLARAGVRFRNVFLPHADRAQYLLWMTLRQAHARGDALPEQEQVAKTLDIVAGLYAGRYGKPLIVAEDAPRLGADEPAGVDPGATPDAVDAAHAAHARDTTDALDTRHADRAAHAGPDLLHPGLRRGLDAAAPGALFPARTSLHLAGMDWMLRLHSREWQMPRVAEAIWALPVLAELRRAVDDLGAGAFTAGNAQLLDGVTAQLRAELDLKTVQVAATKILGRRVTLPATMTAKELLAALYAKMPELHDDASPSLCVYAGPGNRGNGGRRARFARQRTTGQGGQVGHDDAPQRSVGWLLTGDTPFGDDKALAAFMRHYALELPLVETVVLPRHGARQNYGRALAELQALAEALPAGARRLFIAAADPAGARPLPDPAVAELCRRFGALQVVDRRAGSAVYDSVQTADVDAP